MYQFFFIRN